MKHLLTFILIFSTGFIYAQDTKFGYVKVRKPESQSYFAKVDSIPEYSGKYLSKEIKALISIEAEKKNYHLSKLLKYSYIVRCYINKNGEVCDIKPESRIKGDLKEIIISSLMKLKPFRPVLYKGKYTAVYFYLPITLKD